MLSLRWSTLRPMSVSTSYLNEFSEPIGYLDFAAIGPPSLRVRNAVAEAYSRVSEPEGPVGPVMLGRYEAALAKFGRFLGVEPELVTTVPNTSTALFHVAFGLAPFGGNIVVPVSRVPHQPLSMADERQGWAAPRCGSIESPDRRVTAGALSDAVDDETRAIAVSAVDYLVRLSARPRRHSVSLPMMHCWLSTPPRVSVVSCSGSQRRRRDRGHRRQVAAGGVWHRA